jgi:glycosyltransferase 2 family protein
VNVLNGMTSIKNVKSIPLFLFYTFLIWFGYFLSAYLITFSLPQTSGLSIMAGFAVLLMGSLGMAAPSSGGIGTVHVLVSAVLVLYGLTEEAGLTFATLMHTTQYVLTLVGGFICFIIALAIQKKNIAANSAKIAEHEYIREN